MAALIGISKPASGDSGASGDSSSEELGEGVNCTVPLDLLSEDGVPPQQGDSVSFSVDGSVTSEDGTNAIVSIKAVNGKPVSSASADASSAPDPNSSAGMKQALLASNGGSAPPSGMF